METKNFLTLMRSAIVQAGYNERMARILVKEIAFSAIIGAVVTGYFFGIGAFWWGLLLFPIILTFGIYSRHFQLFFFSCFGALWAFPFILIAEFTGWSAFWGFAVIAFLFSFWVHYRALVYYDDVTRDDNGNIW